MMYSFVLIGLAAGLLARRMMQGSRFGVAGDIVVGVVGAFIGGFLFQRSSAFAGSGFTESLIVETIGALVALSGLRLIKKA